MNKNIKLKIILSSLAIFLPPVICILFEKQLSEYLPYFSGGFDKKSMGFITGFLLVLHLAAICITYLDNKRKNQSEKMFNIIFWIIPVISLFCNGISVMSFAQFDINIFVGVFWCFACPTHTLTKESTPGGMRTDNRLELWVIKNSDF